MTGADAAVPGRHGRYRRWAAALGVAALTSALATGCGIRPTAIPVDAGAPASRTACSSPVHPPAAPTTPAPTVAKGATRSASAAPSVSPAPTSTPSAAPATPGGSLFSALPSTTPSANTAQRCD
ncbi:hypothetical protein GCM10009665_12950 [Kitasatospora nipponensis]|uniref:Uncharacterized protein n=1 Tax=Kitasatospora nipponensis TaxID=258049 RepID=A0ABN1VXV4_9ACTN